MSKHIYRDERREAARILRDYATCHDKFIRDRYLEVAELLELDADAAAQMRGSLNRAIALAFPKEPLDDDRPLRRPRSA